MTITLYAVGQQTAFEEGDQVAALQKPWIIVFAEFVEANGVDPTHVRFVLPDEREARFFKTENGWNYQLVPNSTKYAK